jgi:serine/threonine protein kinase
MKEEIGGGKFSRVFKGQNKLTGEFVAVKTVEKKKLDLKEREFLRYASFSQYIELKLL